jgi:hypothetical protein
VRILYAAGNRVGSRDQLRRLVASIRPKKHIIKIAAYSKSMGSLNIDYNLDSLLNFSSPNGNITFNNNYSFYYNEIKRFAPDLIISDTEVYSSIIGLESNLEVWQVSPILLYTSTPQSVKYSNQIKRNHAELISRTFTKKPYMSFIINNSAKRLVYSHLCDTANPPLLKAGYEWIRPEFFLDDQQYRKSISITNGSETELADAFYNESFAYSQMDYNDIESVVASYYNEQFLLGKIVNSKINVEDTSVNISLNESIKFLSELV